MRKAEEVGQELEPEGGWVEVEHEFGQLLKDRILVRQLMVGLWEVSHGSPRIIG